MTCKILVVGGSYGGLAAIKNLLKLTSLTTTKTTLSTSTTAANTDNENPLYGKKFEITLIDPRSGFINIMAIPKLILDPQFAKLAYVDVSEYGIQWDSVKLGPSSISTNSAAASTAASNATFHIGARGEKILKNSNIKLNFIQGYVTNLLPQFASYTQQKLIKNRTPSQFLSNEGNEQPQSQKQQQQELEFDYCILASGRARNWPFDPLAVTHNEFVQEMQASNTRIRTNDKISIIGGGALGIEVAGEIKQQYPGKQITLIHPHSTLPPEPLLSSDYKHQMKCKLQELGIELNLNTRIAKEIVDEESGNPTSLQTTNGKTLYSELNLWCNYHRNNISYLQNKHFKDVIVGKDEVQVNQNLQIVAAAGTGAGEAKTFKNIFAIGDLPQLGVIKKAGVAIRTADIAASNIILQELAKDLQQQHQDQEQYDALPPLAKFPPGGKWPLDKMAIVIGSKNCVQSKNGEILIDNPGVLRSYQDYKVSKVNKILGLKFGEGETGTSGSKL